MFGRKVFLIPGELYKAVDGSPERFKIKTRIKSVETRCVIKQDGKVVYRVIAMIWNYAFSVADEVLRLEFLSSPIPTSPLALAP